MYQKKHHLICPIHEVIEVSDLEMKAIDHKLTQKLRHVLQNDVLQYVFTSATHTRLSHSIGTMHIAGNLLDKMLRRKCDEYISEQGNFINGVQQESIRYLVSVIRLAALFHDLGHASFSHQLEKTQCLEYILKDPGTFRRLWGDEDISSFYSFNYDHIEHEHYSVRAAYEVMKDIELVSYGIRYEDVLNCMDKTDGFVTEEFTSAVASLWDVITFDSIGAEQALPLALSNQEKSTKFMKLMRNLISGELDVDKMDYLLRDSYFCGVEYGKFNLKILMQNINIDFNNNDGWLGLSVNDKALGMVENIITSRFDMFNHVYNHKTSNGFELLLNLSIEEVLQLPSNKVEIEQCFNSIESYINLTDDFMWQKFKIIAKQNSGSYSSKLLNRNRLQYLGKMNYTNERDRAKRKKELEKLIGGSVASKVITTKFSNVDSNFFDVMVLSKDPISKLKVLDKIVDSTDFFNRDKMIKTVYYHAL